MSRAKKGISIPWNAGLANTNNEICHTAAVKSWQSRLANDSNTRPMLGKHHTEETKQKMRRPHNCVTPGFSGHKHNEKSRQKMSLGVRAWLQTEKGLGHPAYARSCGSRAKPTSTELELQSLLDEHFPGQFRYVGDGQVIIGKKCPDFINVNGKKQVIELFGCFWHHCPLCCSGKAYGHKNTEESTVKAYAHYGFDCIIIWEHELASEERVLAKIGK